MFRRIPLVLGAAFLLAAPAAAAQVLLIDTIRQAPDNTAQGLPRPTPGMSSDRVRARFGEPGETISAVGDPPISSWIYDGFTVYFEHDHTITAVVHQ